MSEQGGSGTGEATVYTEAIGILRQRMAYFGIKYQDFDAHADFAPGYSGKVFGPSQVKRLGIDKFFDAVTALGLRIKLEEDPEQCARMRARIAENYLPRNANNARPDNHASPVSTKLLSRVFRHLSREGVKKRWRGISKKKRSEHGRNMAMARWGKKRRRARI